MSSYTLHVTENVFSSVTFDNKYQLEEAIEEEERTIKANRDYLLALVTTTEPNKMFDPENGPIINQLLEEFNNTLSDYASSSIMLSELRKLLNEWDECHTTIKDENGKDIVVAKAPPKGFTPPYLSGDYIRTDRDDEYDE